MGSGDLCQPTVGIRSEVSMRVVRLNGSQYIVASILFDPNSAALVTKAENEAYGEQGRVVDTSSGPRVRMYTQESMNLPGIVYDMYYQEVCSGSPDDITHTWKIVTRGDTFLNPLGCNNDRTGILKFVCGSPA